MLPAAGESRVGVRDAALAALVESTVRLVATVAGVVVVMAMADEDFRAELRERGRVLRDQLTGAAARQWRESPRALFARRRRDELVAAEMAAPDPAAIVT